MVINSINTEAVQMDRMLDNTNNPVRFEKAWANIKKAVAHYHKCMNHVLSRKEFLSKRAASKFLPGPELTEWGDEDNLGLRMRHGATPRQARGEAIDEGRYVPLVEADPFVLPSGYRDPHNRRLRQVFSNSDLYGLHFLVLFEIPMLHAPSLEGFQNDAFQFLRSLSVAATRVDMFHELEYIRLNFSLAVTERWGSFPAMVEWMVSNHRMHPIFGPTQGFIRPAWDHYWSQNVYRSRPWKYLYFRLFLMLLAARSGQASVVGAGVYSSAITFPVEMRPWAAMICISVIMVALV